MKKYGLLIVCAFLFAVQVQADAAEAKKFKRALIIGGGGITPGVGLGIIAGAQKMGWEPDVIITTCGASMASAIANSFPDSQSSLAFAKGPQFFALMQKLRIGTKNVLSLKKKFDLAKNSPGIADYFKNNLLYMNDDITGFLPNATFNAGASAPRLIMLSALAHFGPRNIGRAKSSNLFTQVYFTDSETAQVLQNLESPILKLFPQSYLTRETIVITDKPTDQAARASISDPYLINPAKIDNQYYFTGAVDLFPIELAEQIADEILVTYPEELFESYENLAIESTFGFNQTQRVLHSIQHTNVKWIDINGIANVKFDPSPSFLKLVNHVPTNLQSFAKGIQKQYDFGFARAQEALVVQKSRLNVRNHLRKPISKKLLKSFTCENAYAWRTANNNFCVNDFWTGCNRMEEVECTPIR